MVDETITYFEMTDPSHLVPERSPPAPLDLQEVGVDSAALVGSIWQRIGAPHGWTGRAAWSDADWDAELSRPGVRTWIAMVGHDVAGLVELEADPAGDVGIVVLGLVPEFVGRGFGRVLLARATKLAWKMAPGGRPTKRVWVQTSSRDHRHARSNYERRGFTVFRTENRSGESSPLSGAADPSAR